MLSQGDVTDQIFLFQSRGCEAAASAELSPHAHFISAEICQISLQAGRYLYWSCPPPSGGGGQLFYAAHSAHRHNVVLPTASLGASGTVRNEATSDAKPFHENPRFRSEHIKAQVPTFGLFSPLSGGQTQSNRRMLSHQTSSTRWTPPT